MEVHHHSQAAGHRKKWTHYFWEFLMLFLAVFCGFLAEYQLEHKIEKDREKQFIRSLVHDVETDITQLNQIIQNRLSREERLDSLLYLLNAPLPGAQGSSIYFNAIHTGRRIDIRFTPNDGTILQLKNAGGLRLIRRRGVVDSIMKYDVSVRNLISLGEVEETLVNEYRPVANRVFNALVFDQMLDSENNSSRPEGNPALLTYDRNLLHQLSSTIYILKTLNKGQRRDVNKLLQLATNLLHTLKREYNLD